MDLYTLLGIDTEDPKQQQAQLIVSADEKMLDELRSRRISNGLSLDDVAERMGLSTGYVLGIENGTRDPHLSTMRRYVHAVGAVIQHQVLPAPGLSPAGAPEEQ